MTAQIVPTISLRGNQWNPNRQDAETFAKVKASIQQHGFIDPVLVREVGDSLEIVDGEHKWLAATQLGIDQIPVIVMGPNVSDASAKKLTILMNELRGSPDPVLMAGLIKDLNSAISLDDLATELPMSKTDLEALVNIATPFDWDAAQETIPADASQPVQPLPANERRFQIGQVKGSIAASLCDLLMEEFNRSSRAVGTSNPEIVLGHWLARLKATTEETDEQAAAVAASAPPPAPKKRRKAS